VVFAASGRILRAVAVGCVPEVALGGDEVVQAVVVLGGAGLVCARGGNSGRSDRWQCSASDACGRRRRSAVTGATSTWWLACSPCGARLSRAG
jgi:hypothetical protein